MPLPSSMRAIRVDNHSETPLLRLENNTPLPALAADELLIKVSYAGVNRADIFQKLGKYPPPKGASEILGLEASGTVVACGNAVKHRKVGDEICALLNGGGYADYVAVTASQTFSVPEGWDLKQAAILPEALFTVYMALFHTAKIKASDHLLFHGGASGIGHFAIQMAKAVGASVTITASTNEKCAFAEEYGATTINYHEKDFAEVLKDQQFSIIVDIVGGDYMQKNLKLLAQGGNLINLAYLRGSKAELNMAHLLFKQAHWHGLTLRNRSKEQKARLAEGIRHNCWSWLVSKQVMPHCDSEFSIADAEKAHQHMQQNLNLGKILLKVSD